MGSTPGPSLGKLEAWAEVYMVVLDDIDNTTDMSINGVIIQDAVTMEMMAEKLMDFFFFGLDLLPNSSVV